MKFIFQKCYLLQDNYVRCKNEMYKNWESTKNFYTYFVYNLYNLFGSFVPNYGLYCVYLMHLNHDMVVVVISEPRGIK